MRWREVVKSQSTSPRTNDQHFAGVLPIDEWLRVLLVQRVSDEVFEACGGVGGPASAHIMLLQLDEQQGTKTKRTHQGLPDTRKQNFPHFLLNVFFLEARCLPDGLIQKHVRAARIPLGMKVLKVNLDLKRFTDCFEVQHWVIASAVDQVQEASQLLENWVQALLKHSSLRACKVVNVGHVLLRCRLLFLQGYWCAGLSILEKAQGLCFLPHKVLL